MYFRTREDEAWRYQTTSSQYGQFYKAIDRETQRYKRQHEDCDMQEAQLREELHEAKACLEMINQGDPLANQWPYGPRGSCCFDANAKGRECPCRQKQPVSKNRYNLNSLEAWNCGQNPESEFLEDHVNCYHPRVGLKPLIPKITFGYPSEHGWSAREVCRGDCSGRGFGSGGEPRAIQTSPAGARSSFYSNRCGGPRRNKGTNVLPDTSRYGYYRYYGLAGKGAKTSKGCGPRP